MSNPISKHTNPRGQAAKTTEMTVRRALAIIQVFDNPPAGAKDWTDYNPKDIKNAMGSDRFDPTQAVIVELWARYKDKRLHQQVRDLADNLDMDSLSKKARTEIEKGMKTCGI